MEATSSDGRPAIPLQDASGDASQNVRAYEVAVRSAGGDALPPALPPSSSTLPLVAPDVSMLPINDGLGDGMPSPTQGYVVVQQVQALQAPAPGGAPLIMGPSGAAMPPVPFMPEQQITAVRERITVHPPSGTPERTMLRQEIQYLSFHMRRTYEEYQEEIECQRSTLVTQAEQMMVAQREHFRDTANAVNARYVREIREEMFHSRSENGFRRR